MNEMEMKDLIWQSAMRHIGLNAFDDNVARWENRANDFKAGAKFGYSLASQTTQAKRPSIKEYLGEHATLDEVHSIYNSQPELFNYAQALDNYIDQLEEVNATPTQQEENG